MISEWEAAELDSYYNNFYDYLSDSDYVTIYKKKEIDEKGLDTEPLSNSEQKAIWLWALEDMSEDGLPLWKESISDGGFKIGVNKSVKMFGKQFYKQQKQELGKDPDEE